MKTSSISFFSFLGAGLLLCTSVWAQDSEIITADEHIEQTVNTKLHRAPLPPNKPKEELVEVTDEINTEQRVTLNRLRETDKNYVTASMENDMLGGGTDEYYTSGVRLTWFNTDFTVPVLLEKADDVVPTVDFNTTTSTFYTLGQNIYTPDDITEAELDPDDRPYAAFLYGSAGMSTIEDNHIDEFEVTLGVVGPEALGEQAQKFIHKHVSDSNIPKGWKNQLDFEPGVIVSLTRRWPVAYKADFGDFRFQAEPNVNVSLGNIYTYAGTGLNFTFGPYQGKLQDTPPRVRPAIPGTGYFETPDQGWSWYLFAGIDGRVVGRNIFLDGNTFKDSPSVDKKYFVGDASAGAAITLGDYRLSYSYNLRSKEFDGQDKPSAYGSLSLSTKF